MKRAPHHTKKAPQQRSFGRLIGRPQILIFSMVFSATVLMIIHADSIISNLSLHSTSFGSDEIPNLFPSYRASEETKLTQPGTGSQTGTLIPPLNSTRESRIAWLQEKLPELHIFRVSERAERFHERVMKFFGDECRARFFMIWLSPADQFGPREFLSIDSLFKAHPSGCLLVISGSMDSAHGLRNLKPAIEKGFKVISVTPNLPFLVDNTPARAWLEEMKGGKRDPGVIPLGQNLSNLIRLAFLYKYGGVYVDMDFIVLRKFDGLRNTIGAQTIETVARNRTAPTLTLNNAVLVFDPAHLLVYKFLEEFSSTFNGNKWGFNGPFLITRVMKRLGLSSVLGSGHVGGCNFTVLPPEAFYPVDWIRIGRLFRSPRNRREAQWVEDEVMRLNRVAYGIHLWNKRSRRMRIEEGSVMEKLVSEHCVICRGISGS